MNMDIYKITFIFYAINKRVTVITKDKFGTKLSILV